MTSLSPAATIEDYVDQLAAAEATIDALTGALVEANDQLLAVYDLAGLHAQSLDENHAVREVLQEACRLLSCDRAVLVSGGDEPTRSYTPIEVSIDWLTDQADRFLSGHGQNLADDGKDLSALVVPVTSPNGALALALGRARQPFLTGERRLAEAIADALNGVLVTSALHRQALMASEHETAATLAQLALPKRLPQLAGIDMAAVSRPARAAGGDFFAHAAIDGALHFVVGDVSGKGLPAAIMMATLVSASNAAIRRYANEGPAAILHGIDVDAYDYLSEANLFATMMVGSLRADGSVAHFANAGHGPLMVVSERDVVPIEASVPPVGVIELTDIETVACKLPPGAVILAGSDGLSEQENAAGAMLGEESLAAIVRDRMGQSSADIVDHLFAEVDKFANGTEQSDDRTIVVVQRSETHG